MLGKGKGEGEDKHEGQTNKPKERRKSKDEKGPERVEKDMASGPAFLIKLYARCQCAVVLLPSILEPSLCFSNFSWAPLGPRWSWGSWWRWWRKRSCSTGSWLGTRWWRRWSAGELLDGWLTLATAHRGLRSTTDGWASAHTTSRLIDRSLAHAHLHVRLGHARVGGQVHSGIGQWVVGHEHVASDRDIVQIARQ